MSTDSTNDPYPPEVMNALREIGSRVQGRWAAVRLWERVLSDTDRERLQNDLDGAYRKYRGAVGMWMRLRGVSQPRAIVEVAFKLNLLTETDRDWLLREIGEQHQTVEDAIQTAVRSVKLVLVEQHRELYWRGELVDIDWHKYAALWNFLWELARRAKEGGTVDHTHFGEHRQPGYVSKTKHRLSTREGFPLELAGMIVPAGRSSAYLDLPADQIRLFAVDSVETLRETRG